MEKKFSHSELVDIGAKWANKHKRFPVVATEMKCIGSREQPDVLAFTANNSLMIECKTSMADFKKPERMGLLNAISNYRLYLAPTGIIQTDLVPECRGLIEVNEKGRIEVIKFKCGNIFYGNCSHIEQQNSDQYFHNSDLAKERSFLYSMLRRK